MTQSQGANTRNKLAELQHQPGFANALLNPLGQVPSQGDRYSFPPWAGTHDTLATAWAEDFYRGARAEQIAGDLALHQAVVKAPLSLSLSDF